MVDGSVYKVTTHSQWTPEGGARLFKSIPTGLPSWCENKKTIEVTEKKQKVKREIPRWSKKQRDDLLKTWEEEMDKEEYMTFFDKRKHLQPWKVFMAKYSSFHFLIA